MPMLSIGIDVSKGKSTVCGMKPGGEIVYAPFEVQHTRKGMSELVSLLRSSGEEVRAVLESTGSYHCPVVAALLENGIFVSVINSLRRYRHTTHILEMGETRFRKDYCKWAEKGIPQLRTYLQFAAVDTKLWFGCRCTCSADRCATAI